MQRPWGRTGSWRNRWGRDLEGARKAGLSDWRGQGQSHGQELLVQGSPRSLLDKNTSRV